MLNRIHHFTPVAGFSLIEITLSLGIVGFALVGILGALPLAMSNGRYSVEQTRAANIASTLFASFRAQPFNKVAYLSVSSPTVDLAVQDAPKAPDATNPPAPTLKMYATFTDGLATGSGCQFQAAPAGAEYLVDVTLNNQPGWYDSTQKDPSGGSKYIPSVPTAGISSQVEVAVSAIDHPREVYRFVSIIAKRAQ